MDNKQILAGDHQTVAANIAFTSMVDLGDSTISMYSQGCGPATGTGNIELSANGKVTAQAGAAMFQLTTSLAGQSTAVLDGGPVGSVVIANGLPVGNAQTIELDSKMQSLEISNGNVPGAMQSITMDGLTQSLEMSAGGLPISPTISMTPTGIKLSMGPVNYIEIGPEGVTISGLQVAVKGQVQTDIEGLSVNVKAMGIAKVQAGMVMIN